MKKQALGKGLKAYLSDDYGIFKEERFAEVPIEKLKPNPLQPRKLFTDEGISDLARSIKESGILQPIVVVPEDDYYKIIIGERRWRASQKVGLTKVPVLIRTMREDKQIEAALIENLQREDLNPIEIATAYQRMTDELQYTQAEVAEKVGKDRVSVTNYLRLLKLPQKIKSYLEEGRLSMGHARALIGIEDPDQQLYLADLAIRKGLSVRETERMSTQKKPSSPQKELEAPDPNLMALQDDLIRILGTKVAISGSSDKGSIKIHYFSLDELNRIYDIIKETANER